MISTDRDRTLPTSRDSRALYLLNQMCSRHIDIWQGSLFKTIVGWLARVEGVEVEGGVLGLVVDLA